MIGGHIGLAILFVGVMFTNPFVLYIGFMLTTISFGLYLFLSLHPKYKLFREKRRKRKKDDAEFPFSNRFTKSSGETESTDEFDYTNSDSSSSTYYVWNTQERWFDNSETNSNFRQNKTKEKDGSKNTYKYHSESNTDPQFSEELSILQLDVDYTTEELDEAYRNRVKETHPDLTESDTLEEFKKVKEAYNTLKSKED